MATASDSGAGVERTADLRQAQPGSDGLNGVRNAAYGAKDGCKNHNDGDIDNIERFGFQATGAIEHIFRKNMLTWDKDANGWVSLVELENAQFDAKTSKDSDVVVWHALRSNIDGIQSLSNDEYGLENDGITLKDVEALQASMNSQGSSREERDLLFNVKMSAFDADRMLQPVDPENSRLEAGAGRTAPEAVPTSYSSITRKGSAHYIYRETENPAYPGVSYPSKPMQMITEPIMMGWPKEVHEYLTKEKGGRYTGEEADLSGIDMEKLKKQSKDGKAFHAVDPGSVMDVIHNDDSLARYYTPDPNWTVEQRAEARGYSQQGDFQRMFDEHLKLWDANKNGALSREEVIAHLDDKFQSRESALMMAAMIENGSRMQHYANDLPARTKTDDFEVSQADARRLSKTFDSTVEALRSGQKVEDNKEWEEMRGTLSYLSTQITRTEIAQGGPKKDSTYRDLWTVALQKQTLKK